MQLDDGPAIPCGTSEGKVDLQGLSEGEHQLVTSLTGPGSTSLVAQHTAVFVVGEPPSFGGRRRMGRSRTLISSICSFGERQWLPRLCGRQSVRTVMSPFDLTFSVAAKVVLALIRSFMDPCDIDCLYFVGCG